MFASDMIHPFRTQPDWEAFKHKRIVNSYYNPDVHYASFLLPTQLQVRRKPAWNSEHLSYGANSMYGLGRLKGMPVAHGWRLAAHFAPQVSVSAHLFPRLAM